MVTKELIYGEIGMKRKFLLTILSISTILYVSPDSIIRDFAPVLIGCTIIIGFIAGIFYKIGLMGCLTGLGMLVTVINFKAYWFDQQTATSFGIHSLIPIFVIIFATLIIGLPTFFAGVGIRQYLI